MGWHAGIATLLVDAAAMLSGWAGERAFARFEAQLPGVRRRASGKIPVTALHAAPANIGCCAGELGVAARDDRAGFETEVSRA